MRSVTPLLRDWQLLQQRVIPPLLAVPQSRPARVWAIGSAADAVVVAVAFTSANGSDHGRVLRAFVSDPCLDGQRVTFALRDVGCVPPSSREACFRRHDRRWVPSEEIAGQVTMGEPADLVDLITLRAPVAAEKAFGRLRARGHVLYPDPPSTIPPGLRPIDEEGRLFEKDAGAHDAVGSGARGDGRLDRPDTLAARQFQQDLVASHLDLARSTARRFTHRGEPTADLEQVALTALVKAARRFEPDRQATFATFARATIAGELKRHFRDKTWMLRVPRPIQDRYLQVKRANDDLGHQLGASPTPAQIAEDLHLSEDAVLEAMEAGDAYTPASLDVPRSDDDDRSTAIPFVDPAFDRVLDRQRVEVLLPKLDHREQVVLKRLYFDNWTQQQVAEEIGVSQMQVSRLRSGTIAKLRSWLAEV